jgi:hypothetical protein
MVFKVTEWEFSNVVDATTIPVQEGAQYLSITDVIYRADQDEYTLYVKSLQNDAEFTLRYWLTARDQGGALIPNSKSRGTLVSLGIALAGEPIGIPNPVDIIGGVVLADVTLSKPNDKGAQYPRVYSFQAVPEDIAILSSIDQYYIPNEE